MDEKIRVLGIAPYENMTSLMEEVAREYPRLELTMFVGDMEQGLEVARNNLYGNYDVVISRGGTARILQKDLDLPVIEVEISMFDVLRTLRITGVPAGRIALVTLAELVDSANALAAALGYDIDLFAPASPAQVEPALEQVRQRGYQTVLCDVICHTAARRMGMSAYLIVSGADSIRRAYAQAVALCRSRVLLRRENLFFRQLLQGQIGQTVVFDREGNLYFTSQGETRSGVMETLRRELEESRRTPERRVIRMVERTVYTIRSRRIGDYVAFFFDGRKAPLAPSQTGMRFLSRPEAEADYYGSIFGYAGALLHPQEKLAPLGQTSAPVMISGEDGTGKERIAELLYIAGPLRDDPFVTINGSLLNDKSWDFLLEHHASPLTGVGSTLYFSGLDAMAPERSRQLLASLAEMDVCRRNRVIFSCVCRPGEQISDTGSLYMDKLGCVPLYLPPLRQMAGQISALVGLVVNHMNADLSARAAGVEPEAVELLRRYPWPHNYTQFLRVLRDLTVNAGGQSITAGDVGRVLQKEQHVGSFSPLGEDTSQPLDLNRPLSEIDRDVAQRVIRELNGNHTAAARRLGISRTTLWRLIKEP